MLRGVRGLVGVVCSVNRNQVLRNDVNCQAAESVARQKLLYEIADGIVHGKVGANGP